MAARLPWMKWFGADWRSDPQLSGCCAATRGIWADAVSAMQQQDTGSLTGTIEILARMLRATPEEMATALAELRVTGTADISDNGGMFTVTSRRLSRECHARTKDRNNWKERKKKQRHADVPSVSRETPPLDVRSQISDPPKVPLSGDVGASAAFADKWRKASGALVVDPQALGLVASRIAEYAAAAGCSTADAEDRALAAFARHVAKWTKPQPLTPSLFIRKWDEIQAEMATPPQGQYRGMPTLQQLTEEMYK